MNVAAAVCLLIGATLALSAGVGLMRFRTTLDRMHAGTKPQVLGVLLVLLAMWLHRPTWSYAGPLLLVGISQVVTVSVAAYMVARAAYTRQSSDDDTELPSSDD
ncbi:monovalent cation/H(+) antiporter subunit G [Nonomuraea sp. PA05]|uniref:monovalent cation/H(+) antiporter subunit G n=1 Tax=Nonomuraea sp. PA05 TaxID=2604466 RepID=UPI0011D89CC5|nr:monovalent cation/H(+) antiporter subunit G [Nonomuraea sp. PA05]TYB65426.1 monovalent cation/H(+) antiporter subunit G [Nonomuraea sp. PA05]